MIWRRWLLAAGLCGMFCLGADLATAQSPYRTGQARTNRPRRFDRSQRRPTVSPYLNLTRDSSAIFPDYQTLVRPQMEFRSAYQSQGRELGQLETQFDDEIRSPFSRRRLPLRGTGGGARFMDFSHYYPGRQSNP